MLQGDTDEYPSEAQRREIFQALVDVQDAGEVSVPQSRKVIAERFGLTEIQVRQIEHEGLEHQWPPL